MNFFKNIINKHSLAAVAIAAAGINNCVAYNVGTLAGSSPSGYADGVGTAAKFSEPKGIAIDRAGNIYVADKNNNCIRKITRHGSVTTFAGGTSGYADGTGTAAQFNKPFGLAIDKEESIYVADSANNSIRKITSQGVVTTLAGSGTAGLVNAAGRGAQFNSPSDVVLDRSGNLYVVDTLNHCIRKISPQGIVTTFAGSGMPGYVDSTGLAAQFNKPCGAAIDRDGNLYVADEGNNNIRKITPQGVVTTLAGTDVGGYVDGAGATAQFNAPCFVAIGQGRLFVADRGNSRIRQIVIAHGVVSTFAGGASGYADAVAASAQFSAPTGIVSDRNGTFYVTDSDIVRKITPSGYY